MNHHPFVFDVRQMIADCGGATSVSSLTNIKRTSVYSMLRRRRATTDQLAELKAAFPTLDFNRYFRVR